MQTHCMALSSQTNECISIERRRRFGRYLNKAKVWQKLSKILNRNSSLSVGHQLAMPMFLISQWGKSAKNYNFGSFALLDLKTKR